MLLFAFCCLSERPLLVTGTKNSVLLLSLLTGMDALAKLFVQKILITLA